jgi:hypothetical protein
VRAVGVVTTGLLLAGAILNVAMMFWRASGWTRYPILLLWSVTPIALLAVQTSSLFLHYMVVLSPFPFLVMGLALGWAMGGGMLTADSGHRASTTPRRVLRLGGWLLLFFVVVVQSILTISLYSTLRVYDVHDDERQSPPAQPQSAASQLATTAPRDTAQAVGTGESYGIEIPMRYWLEVRSAALRQAGALAAHEVLVLTEGTNPLSEERPALVEGIIGPELRGRYLRPLSLAIPLDRPSLVLETWAQDPAESFQRLGERLETVPLPTSSRQSRDATRFYRVPARTPEEWSALAENRLNLNVDGLRLVGSRGPERVRPGETIQLVTFWILDSGSGPTAESVSVRLIDERGQPAATQNVELSEDLFNAREELGVVLRHDLSVSNRAAPGEYRFELTAGSDTAYPARTELTGR